VLLVHMETLVQSVSQDLRVHVVSLDLLEFPAPKVIEVSQEIPEKMVKPERMANLVHKEPKVTKVHQVSLDHPVNKVPVAILENQVMLDHAVLMVCPENLVHPVQWVLLVLLVSQVIQVPRVNLV
jgi:hypothetical protein